MTVYFFGCLDPARKGHFIYGPNGRSLNRHERRDLFFPVDEYVLDAHLLHTVSDTDDHQGLAVLTHIRNWTIISFWDRTGDARGRSNSSFLTPEHVSFDELLQAAQEQYPARFVLHKFTITSIDAMNPAGQP